MRIKDTDKVNIQEYTYRTDYRGITTCSRSHSEQVTGYTTAKKVLEDYYKKQGYRGRLTVILSIEGNPNWCAIYRSDPWGSWRQVKDL